jgi:acyl-CoA synthetase (NDP forming)
VSRVLTPVAGASYLQEAGLPLVDQALVRSGDEAAAAATALGLPVALKLVAAGHTHKSDQGGVHLNLQTTREVRDTTAELLALGVGLGDPDAAVLVQPMKKGIVELIVGLSRDPTFGPVVAVGLGGTLAELIDDVVLGIPPLTRPQATEMLEAMRAAHLLAGYRGAPAADRGSVVDLLLKVSRLAEDDDLLELDLNPVLVGPAGTGCSVVDNRVVLRSGPVAPPSPRAPA